MVPCYAHIQQLLRYPDGVGEDFRGTAPSSLGLWSQPLMEDALPEPAIAADRTLGGFIKDNQQTALRLNRRQSAAGPLHCSALSASSASSLSVRKNSLDWPMKRPSALKPWTVAAAPPCSIESQRPLFDYRCGRTGTLPGPRPAAFPACQSFRPIRSTGAANEGPHRGNRKGRKIRSPA
jgi:hypothetical protein